MAVEFTGVGAVVFLITFFILLPVSFGLVLWTIIDAASKPDEAFRRAGQSKTLWIILPIAGLFLLGFVGGMLAFVYLVVIRSRVNEQLNLLGGYYAFPQPAPHQGWWLASDGRWYPPQSAG